MQSDPIPRHPGATVQRMRIGDVLVDVATREIESPQARRPCRVTPKAMAVLCALAEVPGQVVSRDTLLAQVWPDTLPTDDVLTQAVTQLRKAFGPEGRDHIETIAKSGYRLVAPVEPVVSRQVSGASMPGTPADSGGALGPAAGGGAQTGPELTECSLAPEAGAPPQRRMHSRRLRGASSALAAAAVILVVAAVTWMLGHDEPAFASQTTFGLPAAALERPYRLISSSSTFELQPTLSPDASMVAYSAARQGGLGASIHVQPTTPAPSRQMTMPPPGAADSLPAWSPDGREIAFARRWADGRCSVLVAMANGSSEREVTRCDGVGLLSFSWMPDQSGLLFGSMGGEEAGGIRVLSLVDGSWRALAYDAGPGIDHSPQVSPDGRWIVFARNPQLGDLWRVPARGGRAEQLTRMKAEIRGWSWLPDSRSLMLGIRVDTGTRLYRLDIDERTIVDMGFSDAQAPAVAARSDALAFMRRHPRFGIYRVVEGEGGAGAEIERLFESHGRDVLPSISPDGRQIVFGSDRTGHFELWWADLERPGSLRPIDGLRPDARQLPVWSPDGQRVLVLGSRDGDGAGIFELDPASGQATLLPIPSARPLAALHLPGPSRLLVIEEAGDGGSRLVLYDRGRPRWQVLRSITDVSQARLDLTGQRVLFTRLSADGLWEADFDLSSSSVGRVSEAAPLRWRYRTWAVTGDGDIEYLDRGRDCAARLRRIDRVGDVGRARCLDLTRPSSTNGWSIDPRKGDLYLALAVEDGTDIAFLDELSRLERPTSRVGKWLKSLRSSGS